MKGLPMITSRLPSVNGLRFSYTQKSQLPVLWHGSSSAKASGEPGQTPCPFSRVISSSLTPKQTLLLAQELTLGMKCCIMLATGPGFENWKVVSFWERSFLGSVSEGMQTDGRGRHVAFFNSVELSTSIDGMSFFSIEKQSNMLTLQKNPRNWVTHCKCGICCSFALDIFQSLEDWRFFNSCGLATNYKSLHVIEILLILKGQKASSEMIKAALLLMPLGSSSS